VKPFVVEKAQAGQWLKDLCDTFDIFAPLPSIKGYHDWQRWDGSNLPVVRKGVPKSSIKAFFFPQPEVLFQFNARASNPDAFRLKEPTCHPKPKILFGVRPCDARSVILNSIPYKSDPYFQRKKEEIAIIGFLCEEGCSTCFCKWTGGSPVGKEGMDIAVIDLGQVFHIEVLSDKGEALVRPQFFREPADQEISEAKDLITKAQGQTLEQDAASSLRSKELMKLYNAPFWGKISEPCINCGTCTFLCPTCYCFDIQDETLRGKGRRIRYWDSCMFPLFTQHASGHNPRGDKLKRVRNRFMHKLKYFPDRFGPLSCVGCGRCVRECPVNIDIRQVLKDLLAT